MQQHYLNTALGEAAVAGEWGKGGGREERLGGENGVSCSEGEEGPSSKLPAGQGHAQECVWSTAAVICDLIPIFV